MVGWFGYWYEIPLGVAIAAVSCAALRVFPAMRSASFLCAAICSFLGAFGVSVIVQAAYVEIISPAVLYLVPASLICLGLHVALDAHPSPWALLVLAADCALLLAFLWMAANGPH